MIEHLNYCRQFRKQAEPFLKTPSLSLELRASVSQAVDLAQISTKFILPSGGRLFDDKELRGLDETVELRLPYPYIALEYHQPPMREAYEAAMYLNGEPVFQPEEAVVAPKRIAFARERDQWIIVTIVFCTAHDGLWRVLPECAIPTTNYLNRGLPSINGRVGMNIMLPGNIPGGAHHSDYGDEVGAVMCFLNALQCSNVRVERSVSAIKGKALKAAIPFDTYHILTIEPSAGAPVGLVGANPDRRSPREHLRRGHIRRYETGLKIWVNAAVISGGRGFAKVEKDYRVAA